MATDFTGQLLRNAINAHSETQATGLQSKELQSFDFGTLRMFGAANLQGLLTSGQLDQLSQLGAGQSMQLHLYKRRTKGTGSTRQRKGIGSIETATVTPTFFDGIEEGIDMSLVNQDLRYSGIASDTAAGRKERVERAYQEHLDANIGQVFRAIQERVNDQLLNYVNTNLWDVSTTADSGSFYTTLSGDFKVIPTADQGSATDNKPLWLQRVEIEASQNKFGQEGRPFMLRSPQVKDQMFRYAELGSGNAANVAQWLGYFDQYEEQTISETSTAGKFYAIDSRSIAMYNRVFDYTAHPSSDPGMVKSGNDVWREPITIGQEAGYPGIKVEIKEYSGYADNYATYGYDEARIDLVNNWSFYTQVGALKAYYSEATQTPILGYQFATS